MATTRAVTLAAQTRVGSWLTEKWRLDRLVGVGGMAAVFAATHRTGSLAAIKILHRELAADETLRARFLREAYAANRVRHPSAVSVLDDDVAPDGSVFLVMELLEGESIDARWRAQGKRLPLGEVLWVADRTLDALAVAHGEGIVHRDVKPDNLFFTTAGTLKLLDFGIARLLESSGATRTGSILGTPAFMSPEQARGQWKHVDAQSDLWAVGATMFTLLSGSYVHEAETGYERLLAAMTMPARSIASVVGELPDLVVQIIDTALAFERSRRWADARAMQATVRDAYARVVG